MSDRDQAIKDVAKATKSSKAIIAQILEDGVSLRVRFAISQRERVIQLERDNQAKAERVIALERALREILLPVDIREVHCAEWAEKVRQIARAALNGESK